jgi:hypothetical protein
LGAAACAAAPLVVRSGATDDPPYRPGEIAPRPQQIELQYVHPGKVFTADDMNQIIRAVTDLQRREGRYRA